MAEEGDSGGNGPPPAPRQTAGKGRSGGGGGSRDEDEYEGMEAGDADADEAQARLNEIEESADQDAEALLQELEEIQAQGPGGAEAGSGSPSRSDGPSADRDTGYPSSDDSTEDTSRADGLSSGAGDGGPPTSEFARDVFDRNAVADKHLDGDGETNIPPAAESDHERRFGGFNEFSRDDVDEWVRIKGDSDEGRGATDKAKDRGELTGRADIGTETVYRTKYGDGENRLSNADLAGDTTPDDLKTNQMATYAFVESLGVETPRFTYDADHNEVISEAVGDGNPKTIKEITFDQDSPTQSDIQRVNSVSREEFIDKAAVQALAGNWDQSSDNIMVGEDGSVLTFDYDRSNREFGDYNSLTYVTRRAATTADKLDTVRDADNQLNISKQDIASRAAQIAYELEESGKAGDAIEAVEAQMDAMADHGTDPSSADNHNLIRRNIEVGADIARNELGRE